MYDPTLLPVYYLSNRSRLFVDVKCDLKILLQLTCKC